MQTTNTGGGSKSCGNGAIQGSLGNGIPAVGSTIKVPI